MDSVEISNCSVWPINKTLSDATTPSQNEPGSNGRETVLRIQQNSRITGASPSDCLVAGHSLEERGLPLCRDAVGLFYSPRWLGKKKKIGRSPRSVVDRVLNCDILVGEFEHESHYYVHSRINSLEKGMNSLFQPRAMS